MEKVRYAVTSDGAHLGYRICESTADEARDLDIVMVAGGMIPLEVYDDEPGLARMIEGLRGIGRLIVFDRRGVGTSDPITDWDRPAIDQWSDDLGAIVDQVAGDEVVVFAWDTFGVATRWASETPPKLKRLVLFQPRGGTDDEWARWAADRLNEVRKSIGTENNDLLAQVAPSKANDPTFRDWYERAGRVGASPAMADRIWASVVTSINTDQHLAGIVAPTLVLYRPDTMLFPSQSVLAVAAGLPESKVVELDGADVWPFVGDVDAVVAEISDFVIGERRVPTPERSLMAVLFTDLVDSTRRAAELGDARWKALLDRHDRALRGAVGRCGGTVVKTTGDGILAVFPSAGSAVRAADRLRRDVANDELEVRIGMHVGDVDQRGDDVSGLAVNIAARVMSKAGAGEIFATASVAAAIAGQGPTFATMGVHALKGVPGEWELFKIDGI